MLFGTLEEYNKELAYMEKMLSRMEKRIQENPNEIGTQGNYNSMKYLYNHFSEDKQDFISMMNEINLKLKGNLVDNSLLVNNVSALNNKFNDINFVSTNILDSDFNSNQVLLVKEISEGSYNIKYAFPNPTEEDVMRESSRKKGLMKIFNYINCGDDIELLKKEAGYNGKESLIKYKEFLEEIVKNEVDFTLDTENGSLKASLTLQQAKNICNNLEFQ